MWKIVIKLVNRAWILRSLKNICNKWDIHHVSLRKYGVCFHRFYGGIIMLTSLKIATRFLKSSKIQTFIIIFGIAIGISVQIFVGLLSQGLEKSLLSKVIGSLVHISVTSNKDGIESWQTIETKIKNTSKDITTVAPGVQHNALMQLGSKKENIQVRGYFPKDADELYNMKGKVYEGKMVDKDGEGLIGKDLKDKLGINIGDKI
ncbi:MAG: ABC-type transport system, involved in lipoprotein release, permease component, partial [Clostridiaceae bacterium]|nr:ABC-type transport system, involved in lipoprotein release, permease component [Clostridiaceae bacterium]